jgi:hypothetical protein
MDVSLQGTELSSALAYAEGQGWIAEGPRYVMNPSVRHQRVGIRSGSAIHLPIIGHQLQKKATGGMLPALEEIAVVLRKAGWQCEVRAGDKDPGIHFTVYRGVKAGVSGGERPFMSYQPEKQKDTILVNVATKGSAALVGSFTLDKITEDFVQTEATKFFARVASEIG